MARSYEQLCPIARTLDIIGERWTLLILRELSFGRTRFSEFRENLPGIPVTVLSARLKTLEAHGLIERVVYRQHPLRAEYRLTEKGDTLQPILAAMAGWGMSYCLSPEELAAVEQMAPPEAIAAARAVQPGR
jgi:DNA-binding HxlR family transcriptional regulator